MAPAMSEKRERRTRSSVDDKRGNQQQKIDEKRGNTSVQRLLSDSASASVRAAATRDGTLRPGAPFTDLAIDLESEGRWR